MIERTYPNTYPRVTSTNDERRAAWAARYYLIMGSPPNTWRWKWTQITPHSLVSGTTEKIDTANNLTSPFQNAKTGMAKLK